MNVCIHAYMYVIVLSLPPAALQFKEKTTPEGKKKEAIVANILHLLQLSHGCKKVFSLKERKIGKRNFVSIKPFLITSH